MSRFLLTLLLTFSLVIGAQRLQAQTVQQLVELGDGLFNSGQYYGSIGYYKGALNLDSTDAAVLYKYGVNLARLNNNKMATRYLLKSSLLGGDAIFDQLDYELAEAYRKIGEYRKARRYYSRAIQPYRRQQETYWYKRINQSEEAASWANKHKNEVTDREIINLGSSVNTTASEFCSSVHEGKLFFTSLRADSVLKGYEIADKHYFSRIYVKDSPLSSTTKEITIEGKNAISLSNKHIGNLSFSKDNITYFSACDTAFNCEIWTAKISDDKLIDPKKLNKNINYPSTNNTQAQAVEINGYTYLYFVSNREGGFGDLDIWIAKKESFGFDKAINLGNVINTPGNEITPFYDTKSHHLYFSSDWHLGFGGYDIFSAQGATTVFENVENLKQPINSSANDYYYQTLGDSAFLTSNRRELNIDPSVICCNDIYKTNINQPSILAKNDDIDKDSSETTNKKVDIIVLNKSLPADLYFHNDEPNPNNRDSTTKESYLKLAFGYLSLKDEYLLKMQSLTNNEQEIEDVRQFFEEDVKQGVNSLLKFMPLLFQELQKGNHLSLTIRGFASSLSESSYNYTLTLRRIESLINYMKSYRNGSLLPYINHTASNGGSLDFTKLPYGDFATKIKEFDNQKLAIYSATAAKQRKIELIAINEEDSNEKNAGKLSFNRMKYDLGEIPKSKEIKRFFLMENTSNKEVKLYNVNTNCDCATIDYPTIIKPNSKEKIIVNIDTSTINGDVTLKLMVVTNSNPNIYHLEINFTLPKN